MHSSYAVTWEEPNGARHSGRLELTDDALTLEGWNGRFASRRVVRYGEIERCGFTRSSGGRLHGRRALVLELAGRTTLKIAGVAQPGILRELFDHLAAVAAAAPSAS